MRYRVVFEYQTEDGAMSDVYNCRDGQQAREKFTELRDSLMQAIDPECCEVVDEPAHYSLINREDSFLRIRAPSKANTPREIMP